MYEYHNDITRTSRGNYTAELYSTGVAAVLYRAKLFSLTLSHSHFLSHTHPHTWTSTSKETCGLAALLCQAAPVRPPSASVPPSPCVEEEEELLLDLDSVATDAGEAGLVREKLPRLILMACLLPLNRNADIDRSMCFPFEPEGGCLLSAVDMLLLRFTFLELKLLLLLLLLLWRLV